MEKLPSHLLLRSLKPMSHSDRDSNRRFPLLSMVLLELGEADRRLPVFHLGEPMTYACTVLLESATRPKIGLGWVDGYQLRAFLLFVTGLTRGGKVVEETNCISCCFSCPLVIACHAKEGRCLA